MSSKNVTAKFIGWQQDPDGAHFPLFNIDGDHWKDGSTVDAATLLRERIEIPFVPPCPYPCVHYWTRMIDGKRCGRCGEVRIGEFVS